MDGFTDVIIDFIAREDSPLGLLLIALSAMVEYIFPPFPGDTITLFAAVLITAYGWHFGAVFAAVMAGSLAGSMLAFYLGSWLRRRRQARSQAAEPAEQQALIDRLVARFHRHGAAYLMINRFLPGIRALFFVAAGMAGMRPLAVLFYSGISAAAWNLAIIAIGSALGANFDTLLSWVQRYTAVVWALIGVIAVLLLIRWLYRRRRARNPPDEESAGRG